MEEKESINVFANDGSFMEMFRKRMEEEKLHSNTTKESQSVSGEKREPLGDSDTCDVPSGSAALQQEQLSERARNIDSAVDKNCGVSLHRLPTPDLNDNSEQEESSTGNKTSKEQSQDATNVPKTTTISAQKKYSLLSHVGKRRGGKLSLKTGTVKKQRTNDTQESKPPDSWSKYMAEVQKYKAHVCADEDKSRPLVK